MGNRSVLPQTEADAAGLRFFGQQPQCGAMATVDGAAGLRVIEVHGLPESMAPQLHSNLDQRASDPLGTVGFGKYFERLWDSRQTAATDRTAAANVFSMFLTKLWDSTRAKKRPTRQPPEKPSKLAK